MENLKERVNEVERLYRDKKLNLLRFNKLLADIEKVVNESENRLERGTLNAHEQFGLEQRLIQGASVHAFRCVLVILLGEDLVLEMDKIINDRFQSENSPPDPPKP